jgi:O-antigen/teichoic acid export membrane protein
LTVSRLVRNIAYNLVGQLGVLGLSLVSAKLVFGRLGGDALGIIYFTATLNVVLVAVLELGIGVTLVKEISANATKEDVVRKLVQSASVFYWLAYVVAALAIFFLAPLIVERWIDLRTMSSAEAIQLVRILGVSTVLSLPQMMYVSAFRGMQRMGTPNVIDLLLTGAQQTGTIVIAHYTSDVVLVAWWISGTNVTKTALLMVLSSRLLPAGSLVPRLDRGLLRSNRRFGTHVMLISILATVHTQADKLVITSLLPVSAVGIYAFMYGAVARGGLLTTSVVQGAFPALSALVGTGDREQVTVHYRRLHDLLCYGLVPFFALIAFAARPLFGAVFDDATGASLVLPASLLALGFFMNGTLNVPYYLSLASNRADIGLRLNLAALVGVLPITVLLTWRFGFAGAAGSWVWYHVFAYAVAVPSICRECVGIPPSEWFHHIARVFALIAGTYGLAAVAVLLSGKTSSWQVLGAAYVGATVLFVVASWSSLSVDSRTEVKALMQRALGSKQS